MVAGAELWRDRGGAGGGTLIILKLCDMERNIHRAECTDTSAA